MTSSDGTERDENRDDGVAGDLDLTDEQADSVTGGVSDIQITKPVDKPSPGH